jgi:alkyl hydroperoxide reductase subunit AhpC
LSFLATVSAFSQNYEISITLNSRNDTVILGHYFAKNDLMIPDDTLVLKKGTGVFRGNKNLAKGVYFLINNKQRLFDFIIGDNLKFGIVADTADFVNLTKFASSPENDVFLEFQRYNVTRGKQYQQLNEQYKNATSDADKNDIRTILQTLIKERIEFIENLADANSNLYVSKFLKTLVPPETHIPEPPKDADGNITDREFQYRWYRAHFFDNFNIFDPDMLRIPYYEEKLFDYMTKVIPQYPDTICAEAGKILAKAKANDEIFRCVMVSLFNHYGNSNVIVHENVKLCLAEKWYIPYATWSKDEVIDTWKKYVEENKSNRIGQPAPAIEPLIILPPEHFKAAALDTAIKFDIHAGKVIADFRKELKKKYTVLFFWDYSCGHCKKSIQELSEVWEEVKNDNWQIITVQTVNTREAKGKWIDLVNEHDYFGWINAWSPYAYKYEDHYRETYGLSTVPKIFILDENSNIFLKNIVPEQLKDIILNIK